MDNIKSSIIVLLLLMLASCGMEENFLNSSNKKFIGGRVVTLTGLISKNQNSSFEAYAAPCTDPVYAKLYSLNASGKLDQELASVLVGSSTQFEFPANSLSLTDDVKYVVEISGCNDVYYRPITNFDKLQDVSFASTLISYVTQVTTTHKLTEIPRSQVEAYLKAVGGNSVLNSYSNIDGSVSFSNQFSNLFASPHTVLLETPPQIQTLNVDTVINEGVAETFSVNTTHFYPSYTPVYRWKLNGVTQSTISNYVYTPDANSQGTKTLTLEIGHDDGMGNIDITKAYYSRNFTITILDTLPATAPSMSVASTDVTARNISIDLDTGAGMGNCDSFTDLAINENSTLPPSAGSFTITCSNAVTQTESYTLASTGDGTKTLRLWARNSLGQINPNPSVLTLRLDTQAPAVAIGAIPSLIGAGVAQSVTFTATDANGLSSLELYYTDDDSTYTLVGSLTTSPYSWTPSADTSLGRLRIIATDTFGQSTIVSSNLFSVDGTPPSPPAVTVTSAAYTNTTSVTMTVASCTDRAAIFVTEGTAPASNAAGWQTCSTTASATTYTLTGTTQGTRTMHVYAKDSSGNVSLTSTDVTVVYDTVNPVVALTSPTSSTVFAGGSSSSVGYTITETNLGATPVTFAYSLNGGTSWTTDPTAFANSSPYSWSVPSSTNISNAQVRITVTDRAGNTATATSSNFKIDSVAPSVSAVSINGGASNTSSYYVRLSLTATDTLSNVTHFCVKRTSTLPNISDTCWVSASSPPLNMTLGLTLNIVDFSFLIGFTPGATTMYVWARDAAGNISTLSSAGAGTAGVDRATITYVKPVPPVVADVVAANIATPNSPPTIAQLQSSSGDAYIWWKATATNGFGATPITIEYSTDDVQYVAATSSIANAQGSGCNISGVQTGCYHVTGLPTSGFFRLRVSVVDNNGIVSSGTSQAFNLPKINFLIGSTDLGTNNSTFSAMFLSLMTSTYGPDSGSLVVSSTGIIYYRDAVRGILKVDPSKGTQEIFLRATGTTSGDGGVVTNATLKWPFKIALDHQDRLVILDYDRIRRVDTSVTPNTISTIVGGGVSTADNVPPLQVQISPAGAVGQGGSFTLLTPLPNGDILFQDRSPTLDLASGFRMRHFHAGTNTVSTITPSGQGHNGNSTANFSAAVYLSTPQAWYDPSNSNIGGWIMLYGYTFYATLNADGTGTGTGPDPEGAGRDELGTIITGQDGKIYRAITNPGLKSVISRYEPTTRAWTHLVGVPIGTPDPAGRCVDGTPATSCKITPQDVFVNTLGQIYFVDKGLIRVVDPDGNVQTLGGVTSSFGDGGLATNARFGTLGQFELWNDGTNDRVLVSDWTEYRYREAVINGNIQTIAGNGKNEYPTSPSSTDANLTGAVVGVGLVMAVDKANGNLYAPYAPTQYGKLNRSTGRWEQWLGGGTTAFYNPASDGLIGTQISVPSYQLRILGVSSNDILIFHNWYNGGLEDQLTTHYSLSNATSSWFAGELGTGTYLSICADGTLIDNNCHWRMGWAAMAEARWDQANTRWLIPDSTWDYYSYQLIRTAPTTPGGVMGTLVSLPRSIYTFDYYNNGTHEFVYYCATDHKLYKYNITTSTEALLDFGATGITCDGSTLRYSSTRNSLMTIYKKNGLYGVMEYLNP